jgi:hypothetical protein
LLGALPSLASMAKAWAAPSKIIPASLNLMGSG